MARKCDEPGTLLAKTLALMEGRDITDTAIATGLPYHWLNSLVQRKSVNPAVNRVQVLYEHLSGKKLEV